MTGDHNMYQQANDIHGQKKIYAEQARPVLGAALNGAGLLRDVEAPQLGNIQDQRGHMNKYQDYIDRIVTYSRNPDKNDAIMELYVKDLISKVKFDSSLDMLNSVLENMKDGTGNKVRKY